MSIVEEAARRLEQLAHAGVDVPWSAAGLKKDAVHPHIETSARPAPAAHGPATVHHLATEGGVVAGMPRAARRSLPPHVGDTVTLDLDALERKGYLLPRQTRSVLAEEFRSVKWPLLANARAEDAAAKRHALIMVTSALPGEGKTFCSINLAMSIAAEIDTSVLLVDADVLRSNLLQVLGVSPRPGLLDALANPAVTLSQVVLPTNVPRLSILPAGTPNPIATELLGSDAMERVLASVVEDDPDRVVIFDAPPLTLTSEAQVLAARVGQVVLVVAAATTPRVSVAHALARLEPCPIVLPLLNKAQRSNPPLGYGYGDSYDAGERRDRPGI